jgi:hypothetical protein
MDAGRLNGLPIRPAPDRNIDMTHYTAEWAELTRCVSMRYDG